MITAFKLIVFVISMVGYGLYINKKIELQVEFIPIVTISMITVILFFGGLLNILLLTSYSILGLGIYLFLRSIILNNKKEILKLFDSFYTPGILIYIIATAYFIFILKDQRLIDYDNFSHWGLIVKSMIIEDSLPNFENIMIQFSSYPPGTALFIYFFCRIVGASEGLALIGQMVIILSSILTLFSFSSYKISTITDRKYFSLKKNILIILTVFVSVYLLNGPSSIHNLLVDTVLNVSSIALIALVYYYLKKPQKTYIPVMFLSTFLILIKNSGLFFVVIGLFIYSFGIFINKDTLFKMKKGKYKIMIPFIFPFFISFLWTRHVAMVFPSGLSSKQ